MGSLPEHLSRLQTAEKGTQTEEDMAHDHHNTGSFAGMMELMIT